MSLRCQPFTDDSWTMESWTKEQLFIINARLVFQKLQLGFPIKQLNFYENMIPRIFCNNKISKYYL